MTAIARQLPSVASSLRAIPGLIRPIAGSAAITAPVVALLTIRERRQLNAPRVPGE